MSLLSELEADLDSLEKMKTEFNRRQRLLVLGGQGTTGLSESDLDEKLSRSPKSTKRKSPASSAVQPNKRTKPAAASNEKDIDSIVHPDITEIFLELKAKFRELEMTSIAVRDSLVPDSPDRQSTGAFIRRIALRSFVVLLHPPLIINMQVNAKPDVVICALAGYASEVFVSKSKSRFPFSQEKIAPLCSCAAHLISEEQTRRYLSSLSDDYNLGQLMSALQAARFHLEYATRPNDRLVKAQPIQLTWAENSSDDPHLAQTFVAKFYNVTPTRAERTLWVDSYHLAFLASIGKDQHFVALTLPFEIASNFARQKESKYRSSVWRMATCVADETCVAQPLQTSPAAPSQQTDDQVHPRNHAGEILSHCEIWFKGYVGTKLGFNPVHKFCLRKQLSQNSRTPGELVDYDQFENDFWPYFFNASEFIKENRKTLWKNYLMNYCFVSASEAEALLAQKTVDTMLIRFQTTSCPAGVISMSIFLPQKPGHPPYLAHINMQSLQEGDPKNYDLSSVIKYSVLYLKRDNPQFERLEAELSNFVIYGRGRHNMVQHAREASLRSVAHKVRTSDRPSRGENGPLIGYTGEREIHYTIEVRPVLSAQLDASQAEMFSKPLGAVLTNKGSRFDFEWNHKEIWTIDSDQFELRMWTQSQESASNSVSQLGYAGIQQVPPDRRLDATGFMQEATVSKFIGTRQRPFGNSLTVDSAPRQEEILSEPQTFGASSNQYPAPQQEQWQSGAHQQQQQLQAFPSTVSLTTPIGHMGQPTHDQQFLSQYAQHNYQHQPMRTQQHNFLGEGDVYHRNQDANFVGPSLSRQHTGAPLAISQDPNYSNAQQYKTLQFRGHIDQFAPTARSTPSFPPPSDYSPSQQNPRNAWGQPVGPGMNYPTPPLSGIQVPVGFQREPTSGNPQEWRVGQQVIYSPPWQPSGNVDHPGPFYASAGQDYLTGTTNASYYSSEPRCPVAPEAGHGTAQLRTSFGFAQRHTQPSNLHPYIPPQPAMQAHGYQPFAGPPSATPGTLSSNSAALPEHLVNLQRAIASGELMPQSENERQYHEYIRHMMGQMQLDQNRGQ